MENFYVRVVSPALVAVLIAAGMTVFFGQYSASLAGSYLVFMLLLGLGIPLLAWAFTARRAAFSRYVAERPFLGLAGGSVGIAIYATTLWAMTVAPVAVVAALRETSILFATVISALVLKERVGPRRLAMVCAIAGGAMMLRLA